MTDWLKRYKSGEDWFERQASSGEPGTHGTTILMSTALWPPPFKLRVDAAAKLLKSGSDEADLIMTHGRCVVEHAKRVNAEVRTRRRILGVK